MDIEEERDIQRRGKGSYSVVCDREEVRREGEEREEYKKII